MIATINMNFFGRNFTLKSIWRKLETLDTFADRVTREAGKFSKFGTVWVTLG